MLRRRMCSDFLYIQGVFCPKYIPVGFKFGEKIYRSITYNCWSKAVYLLYACILNKYTMQSHVVSIQKKSHVGSVYILTVYAVILE